MKAQEAQVMAGRSSVKNIQALQEASEKVRGNDALSLYIFHQMFNLHERKRDIISIFSAAEALPSLMYHISIEHMKCPSQETRN